MFLNRWLFHQEIIELNELSAEEEAAVFSILKPIQGEGDTARYLESEADAVIEQVRRRPRATANVFMAVEAPTMNTTVSNSDVTDRLVDRLGEILERLLDRLRPTAHQQTRPRVLTPDEAAEEMRLNTQTVMKWCRQGRLAATKLGRKWIIPKESVDEHLRRVHLIHGEEGDR